MGLATTWSVSLSGLAGHIVQVEVDISSNLPSFVLVGLPDASLNEASARVRSAIKNTGLEMPARRITVNLSPAAVPKFGSGFDLAISAAVLAASQVLNGKSVSNWLHLGELGLDGSVRPITGILPAVLAAREAGFRRIVVPRANGAEASLVSGVEFAPVTTLAEVAKLHGAVKIGEIRQSTTELPTANQSSETESPIRASDLSDVVGQQPAIRALAIAAAGGHHLLMVGSPGAGKTMLAERLPTILPDLSEAAALETTAIHSIAGMALTQSSENFSLCTRPPFQAPHHSASVSAILGGGLSRPRPGAVSIAHHGVLFLDEAPEFQKPVLEALRQPLESGVVSIHRSGGWANFPARFQLVLAANPCPCGKALNSATACRCPAASRVRYAARLSGPLLDRVDIRLIIRQPTSAERAIAQQKQSEQQTSEMVRSMVENAQYSARERLRAFGLSKNSEVTGALLRSKFAPDSQSLKKLNRALELGRISMRGYDRCLRVAWSIADLAGKTSPGVEDIDEAVFLRGNDEPLG